MPTNKKLTQSSLQRTMGGMVSNQRRTEYAMTVLNNPNSSESNKKEMARYMNQHPDQFVDVSQRGSFMARARDRISTGNVGNRGSNRNSGGRRSRNVDQSKFQRDSSGNKTFTYEWYMNRTAGMSPSRRMAYAQSILDSSDTSEEAKNAVRDHMALFPERYQTGGGFLRRNGRSNRSNQNDGSRRVQGVTLSNEEFDSLSKFQKFIFSHFRRGTRNANAAYALKALVNDDTSSRNKSDIKGMVRKYPQWFFSGRSNGGQ